jgi:UDP-N-acetylglucosamine 2-epimerase (non-hydrolysing)
MKVMHIVGARPNFMKAAPVVFALRSHGNVTQQLVHTGQHYDRNMNDVFFHELGMPQPDHNLGVGSGTHAQQTARIMTAVEPVFEEWRPDLLLVYGDVNSTIACALVASKMGIRIGHVEAGLRSRDFTMPEEINRILTDRISDFYFTPSADADQNLLAEGVERKKLHLVGNCMIDTLVRLLPQARKPEIAGADAPFVLVTLHRPSNVDDTATLGPIVDALAELSSCGTRVIFPIHPRTRKRMTDFGIMPRVDSGVILTDPLGYLEFLWLQIHAVTVVTDSGGIQEETTFLKVPCITLRENTERPITCTMGTNRLVGRDLNLMKAAVREAEAGGGRTGAVPPLWDGKAGERIADIVAALE